ncbi:jg21350 [Pararge aegeria aegeria]|uniref:Jg21350 protein n=1 Tax=Pararge aegeria aegeria TaxID=348720 RepID=A0A8S4S690_9NEOP|nr:jg21350 [Pararge aegeria aegeria]
MEDCESESEVNRNKDRSPSPGVKSTAVVKYTAFQSPVGYARLQCNTDINLPPSNWGGIDTYGLKQILTRDSGLSSFRMAHMFPDCVGEVDVISDAECIKKLLKLPYQPNGTVSMMVHRVENTLLLDDFDVYEYLMKSEWSWLKDFFYENILKTMSEKILIHVLAEKEKVSKYLDLAHEITATWSVESTVIVPSVVSVTGLLAKSFDQHLKKLSFGCWIKGRIQKAVVLETARIVRRFLTLEP